MNNGGISKIAIWGIYCFRALTHAFWYGSVAACQYTGYSADINIGVLEEKVDVKFAIFE